MKRKKANSPPKRLHPLRRDSRGIKGSSTAWADPTATLTKTTRSRKNQPKKNDTIKSCWYFG